MNPAAPDFTPPDPLAVLAERMPGLPGPAAAQILYALREAGCLREHATDFPAMPPGSVLYNDLRLTGWLPPADRLADLGSAGYYSMNTSEDIQIDALLGLLSIAADDIHHQRRTRDQ